LTDFNSGADLAAFKSALSHKGKKSKSRSAIPWTCRVIIAKPVAPPAPETTTKPAKGKPAPEPEPEYLLRANSLAGYWEINRRLVRSLGAAYAAAGGAASGTPPPNPASDEIAATAQISPDSLVGEGSRVADRASIKKCVVGRHCNIGKGAKLTGCVLWDWVTVEDNARIENAILCGNVRIGEKANIKDCEFGPGFEAMPGGKWLWLCLTLDTSVAEYTSVAFTADTRQLQSRASALSQARRRKSNKLCQLFFLIISISLVPFYCHICMLSRPPSLVTWPAPCTPSASAR
jgi:hypothetical protein